MALSSFNGFRRSKKTLAMSAALMAMILIALVIFFESGRSSERDMTVTFAGFTNNLGGPKPHALFWVTNGSSTHRWIMTQVSLKIAGEWHPEGGPSADWRSYQNFLWIIPYGTSRPACLIAVPVSSTSTPMRVVLE